MACTRREVAVACACAIALAVATMTAVDMGVARPAVILLQKGAVGKSHPAVTNHRADKQQLLLAAKAKTQALVSTSDFPYTLDKPLGIQAMAARPDDGVASSDVDAMKLASKLAARADGHVPSGEVADRAAGQTELPPQPSRQSATASSKPSAAASTTHKLAVSEDAPPATQGAEGGTAAATTTTSAVEGADEIAAAAAAAGEGGQQQLGAASADGPSASETDSSSDGSDPVSEIKADDSPIGTAAAARILGDAEGLEKSNGPEGSIEQWKQAAKGSGAKALDEITDDVTSGNPFPNQALSEKMEIQDVWNKAQALARPAGRLDGTAKENKATIANAVAQASAAAYMAANEAAAVDGYDVSMPNPDMMANKKRTAMVGQARAASTHANTAMAGRAAAVAGRGPSAGKRARQALEIPRVQVLAELARADDDEGGVEAMRERAMRDAKVQAGRAKSLRKDYYEAVGAEKEALRLAASPPSSSASEAGNGGKSTAWEKRPAAFGAADAEQQEAVPAVAAAAAATPEGSGRSEYGKTSSSASASTADLEKEAARAELRGALEREDTLERKLDVAVRQDEEAHKEAERQDGDSVGLRAEAKKLRAKLSEAQRELRGEAGVARPADVNLRGAITNSVSSVLGDRNMREAQADGPGAAARKVYRVGGNPLEGTLEG